MTKNEFYFVYVLELNDSSLYIGFTQNLKNRFFNHERGNVRSTKHKLPCKLIYAEQYINKVDALKREKFLKGGSGRKYILKQLDNYFKITHLSAVSFGA